MSFMTCLSGGLVRFFPTFGELQGVGEVGFIMLIVGNITDHVFEG